MTSALPPAQDSMRQLQAYLKDTGRYTGFVDGLFGPRTQHAVLTAMEDGPDTQLSDLTYRQSAQRLGVKPAYIMAFAEVESQGAGFDKGRPKILFEPHRFSRLTAHRYDKSYPTISYPAWGQRPYPKRTDDRYAQLLDAVALDAWAGFCAASYGKFQILGENFRACGFQNPWAFAFAQAYDEVTQLRSFENFVKASGIVAPLKLGLWETVASLYNGTAYRKNRYDEKLAAAAAKWERKLAA